jgi:hypothetical protein
LEGLWIKESNDNFSSTLYIENNRFSYANGLDIQDFFLRAKNGYFILSEREGQPGTQLKYSLKGEELSIWWNDTNSSRYSRSKADNSLDHLISEQQTSVDLPFISQYRLMGNENLIFRICYGKDLNGDEVLTFNGKKFKLEELKKLLEETRGRVSKLEQPSLTALFLIDRSVPMYKVDKIREVLRKNNALHIAEGGYPHGDLDLSPLIFHAVALPRLLPPENAKILDKSAVEKGGGKVHTIDLAARNSSPKEVDENLHKFIVECTPGKYIISLEYDGDTPYGQYVESVDLIYKTVYDFRRELSLERHKAPYELLGPDLQREIRKAFPMALSENMKR